MMSDPFIARMKLDRSNKLAFRNGDRNHEILEQIRTISGNDERFDHPDDQIRLTKPPAFSKLRCGRKVSIIAFGSTRLGPVLEEF